MLVCMHTSDDRVRSSRATETGGSSINASTRAPVGTYKLQVPAHTRQVVTRARLQAERREVARGAREGDRGHQRRLAERYFRPGRGVGRLYTSKQTLNGSFSAVLKLLFAG